MSERDPHLSSLSRDLEYLALLAEIGKALAASLDERGVIEVIVRGTDELLHPRHWALWLADGEGLRCEVGLGGFAAMRGEHLTRGAGLPGKVAETREGAVLPVVPGGYLLPEAGGLVAASVLCLPLMWREGLVGVMQLVRDESEPEPYGPEHLQVAMPLAEFAAIALENARMFHKLEQLTITDDWTGLYNARYLHACLDEEVARAQRYGRSLALIFLDLDGFKGVNDTYGHGAGSALLREIAHRVRRLVRETDRPVRYGGDEFVVIMPETNCDGALVTAERLRLAVMKPVQLGDKQARLTASFGVASHPDDGADARTLLDAADRAMYAAKGRGRNRVECLARKDEPRR
jgi:diguanylate cyclase (GGDEF)-like protein